MARTAHGASTPPAAACGQAPPADSPQLLTVDQAAEYLGTGQRFVRRLISERQIPYVKLGKHVRLERRDAEVAARLGRLAAGTTPNRTGT